VRYAEISLADLRELLEDAEPVQPHPELVAAIRPCAADVVRAAIEHCGWFPSRPYFNAAVPIRPEE
jgi:hypothetical protein